jgi:type II secretory pathway component PulJ
MLSRHSRTILASAALLAAASLSALAAEPQTPTASAALLPTMQMAAVERDLSDATDTCGGCAVATVSEGSSQHMAARQVATITPRDAGRGARSANYSNRSGGRPLILGVRF